jgi:glycosyltransferase involved in cell wall biosynthesis
MDISVIMPSYLGDYEGAAKNRGMKFMRAVNSFLIQKHASKELIIISDGCQETINIYNFAFKKHDNIKLVCLKKQPLFSGAVRQAGIQEATGRIVTYLDSDDMIDVNHLSIIVNNFNFREFDWVYYNDYWLKNEFIKLEHNVEPKYQVMGTSSISHKRKIKLKWQNGFGHDWLTIRKYLLKLPHKKIQTPEYYICHINNIYDF